MTNDIMNEIQIDSTGAMPDDAYEDEFETIGDYHRKAAHHFAEAAKHHLAAAEADDDGDEELMDMHAFKAYRHQLNGVQCAEIAVMESETEDEVLEEGEEEASA
jgi:hypothetical protein